MILMAGAIGQAAGAPITLDRTIVGTEEPKTLAFGPGDERVTRSLDWEETVGRGRPLAGFKQISDVHVVDEESPGRVEYLDVCGSEFRSAYTSRRRPRPRSGTRC